MSAIGSLHHGAGRSLLVTVSGTGLLEICAAFWGLVAGSGFSWLLEKADFQAKAA